MAEQKIEQELSTADHPVLSDIQTTCTEIEQLEEWLKATKQRLQGEIEGLPAKIGDNKDLQDEIVHYLYWFNDQVPKNTLKQTFQFVTRNCSGKNTPNVIKNVYIDAECDTCHVPMQIEVRSRSELADRLSERRRGHLLCRCDACRSLKNEESRRQYELQRIQWQQRLHLLQTVPYREYLQTPEWQETRRRAMKRAGFRCQVCNAYGVQLNVHHRTYERRGNEDNRDLITLCRTCHDIFHRNGQLAMEGK